MHEEHSAVSIQITKHPCEKTNNLWVDRPKSAWQRIYSRGPFDSAPIRCGENTRFGGALRRDCDFFDPIFQVFCSFDRRSREMQAISECMSDVEMGPSAEERGAVRLRTPDAARSRWWWMSGLSGGTDPSGADGHRWWRSWTYRALAKRYSPGRMTGAGCDGSATAGCAMAVCLYSWDWLGAGVGAAV